MNAQTYFPITCITCSYAPKHALWIDPKIRRFQIKINKPIQNYSRLVLPLLPNKPFITVSSMWFICRQGLLNALPMDSQIFPIVDFSDNRSIPNGHFLKVGFSGDSYNRCFLRFNIGFLDLNTDKWCSRGEQRQISSSIKNRKQRGHHKSAVIRTV